MEAVGTIVKVVQEIVKAAETARQNRKRCLDLADRARSVGDILREDRDSTASRIAGGVSKPPLERLKSALDDALELVESQRRSGLGIPKLITSGRTAARFQDVETRITACVADLGLAEQIAARRRDHRANPEEAAPVHEPPPPPQQQQQQGKGSMPQGYQAQSAPPPPPQQHQHGKDGPSLPQGYQAQSVPPPESIYNQYLQQAQQSLLQAHGAYLAQSAPPPAPPQQSNDVLHDYLAQSTQRGKDAQAFLQDYHAQSAQRGKEAQAFLQDYHAQSAQRGQDAQAFLQVYHAQSAQRGKEAQASLQEYHAQSAQRGKDAQALLKSYGYFGM